MRIQSGCTIEGRIIALGSHPAHSLAGLKALHKQDLTDVFVDSCPLVECQSGHESCFEAGAEV